MSNGKGSRRRDAAIDPETERENWQRTFGKGKVPARVVEQPAMVDAVAPCPCCGEVLTYDPASQYYPCRNCATWWTAFGITESPRDWCHKPSRRARGRISGSHACPGTVPLTGNSDPSPIRPNDAEGTSRPTDQ